MTQAKEELDKQALPPCEPLPEVLATRAGFLLNRSAYRIREMTQTALEPLGILPKHYALMAIIHAEGPMTQQAIGDILKVDRTTMVALVDDAEKKGWVVRGEHPNDRRCHLLSLSAAGKRKFELTHKAVQKAEDDFFEVLPPSERDQLIGLLGKLFQPLSTAETDISSGQAVFAK